MVARWCISILIFSLTLFGVVSQQQLAVPNQEIVLQFKDVDLTSEETEYTLAIVKRQLQDLGAQNIKVLASRAGKLKIAYYIDTDLASIKEIFSEENIIVLHLRGQSSSNDTGSFPSEDATIAYNLNVYEIQHGQHSGWDFDGAIGFEFEPKSDRFLDPNYLFANHIGCNYPEIHIHVASKTRREVTLQLRVPLYTIPEVRAGPIA
jgi:hypothetical protein